MCARLKATLESGDRLVLGLSGGIDSVVLLDSLVRARRAFPFELSALHVNHQLSPNAARWAAFCRAVCRARDVPLRVVKVNLARGNSLERAAREARYAALKSARADYIVLAHNLDDQAETVLLQLVRGAGVKGLAGMPALRRPERPAPGFLRPLLDVPRADIERYAKARKLEWVEDESNEDTHYTRNWLRRDVLPILAERVPAVRTTLARAAGNMSEAARLLDDLAEMDWAVASAEGGLLREVLRRLSVARAKNLLRFEIARGGWPMPSAERLSEGLRQAVAARADASLAVDLGGCELRRHGGVIYVLPKLDRSGTPEAISWQGEKTIALPGWGTLEMKRTRGHGVSAAALARAPVTIRPRQGGERLQPAADRPRRTLKNLLQEAGVPPWQRERLPCIYSGETLACVPGLAIDYRFQAQNAEPAIVPLWRAL